MCVSPITIKQNKGVLGKNEYTQPVPCGKCPECLKARVSSWSFRISKELERATCPLFLTLTYNPENLPTLLDGTPTLRRADVQLFLKRLRKAQSKITKDKIKYYGCGEYGSKKGRPHYHLLIMNVHSTLIDKIEQHWSNGFVDVQAADVGTVPYILKYVSKPRTKNRKNEREFSMSSKGLGENYLTKSIIKYHTDDLSRCYVTLQNGIKQTLPKYYKEKIYNDLQRLSVTKILQQRTEDNQIEILKKLAKIYENPEEALEIRKMNLKFDKPIREVF